MWLVLSMILFLLLAISGARDTSDGSSHRNTYRFCAPTRCSPEGPLIRFPFRRSIDPPSCGLDGFELSCSNNKTMLHLPFSGDYPVQDIDYIFGYITVMDARTACTLQSLLYLNLTNSVFACPQTEYTIVNCTQRDTSWSGFGPFDCISTDDRHFFYAIYSAQSMGNLPSTCSAYGTVDSSFYFLDSYPNISLGWPSPSECHECEMSGNYCMFNVPGQPTICCKQENPTICFEKPRHPSIIKILVSLAASIGGLIFIALVILLIYKSWISVNQSEIHLKVEKFLEDYRTLNPTRYNYNDLKKITGRFKHRLGQGGYGSVFRGKLSNGIPVAVKMLEHSIRNGEEFINEVATIGRIHHFNVVRLLGFYSEGTRQALIYEFMPNASLEKFIFSNTQNSTRLLSWEKLWKIAIGVARGIEYLHQGCNQRILHFDIKPHNILLDHNFQPKISDFGLAKLCSKEQSIVSMTAARGTAGYIAPELFSRNFGEVSYKSDVFSYGMMLLEMVGCRKNIDLTTENESQIFFPEWIYNKMSQGAELGLEVEADGDEEIAKKLAIVGLWCIQWNPTQRPSMPMVIQILEGDLQSLDMPPKPFVSSDVETGED